MAMAMAMVMCYFGTCTRAHAYTEAFWADYKMTVRDKRRKDSIPIINEVTFRRKIQERKYLKKAYGLEHSKAEIFSHSVPNHVHCFNWTLIKLRNANQLSDSNRVSVYIWPWYYIQFLLVYLWSYQTIVVSVWIEQDKTIEINDISRFFLHIELEFHGGGMK